MTHPVSAFKRAIPILVVGMAFFLSGCQPRVTPREEPVSIKTPPPEPGAEKVDLFARGEAYARQGAFQQAMDSYGAFVQYHPRDPRSPQALHRMAEISRQQGKPEKTLELLRRMVHDYPTYPQIPEVRVEILQTLYRLGRHEAVRDEALQWMDQSPSAPQRGEIAVLLGNSLEALGDLPQALLWLLRAKETSPWEPQQQVELHKKILGLIQRSGIKDLVQMSSLVGQGPYGPEIYLRLSSLYLQQGNLEEARKAASALIRSTPDEAWVSRGREMLQSIQGATQVRPGVVGCLLPLSGPFAPYGEEVLNGILLGLGLLGGAGDNPVIELIIRDTEGKPESAMAAADHLIDKEKVMALIGPLASNTALPVARKAQSSGVPIITLTQNEEVVRIGDMVFRNSLTPTQEVTKLLDTAMGLGLRRFSILYPRNAYGEHLMNLFRDKAMEMGAEVAVVEAYSPSDTDFSKVIKRLVSRQSTHAPLEAVFIPDNYQGIAMIAPQFIYNNIRDIRLLGTSPWQSKQLMALAGDYLQGAIFTAGFFDRSQRSGTADFVLAYESSFGTPPGVLAAIGYDTIRLLKKAIHEKEARSRKAVQEALLPQVFEGVTGRTAFAPEGGSSKEPLALTITGRQIRELP